MTYLYILAGIWTSVLISSDGDKPSRLERYIRAKEALVEVYKQDAR